MNSDKALSLAISLLILSFFLSRAEARLINGTLTGPTGKPLAGALISKITNKGLSSETFYSDPKGHYSIEIRKTNDLSVRFRHFQFEDLIIQIRKPQDLEKLQRVSLRSYQNFNNLADTLPASFHAKKIFYKLDPQLKDQMISQCFMCHQLGSPLTRSKKDSQTWEATIERMEGMGALLTNEAGKIFPKVIKEAFEEKFPEDSKYFDPNRPYLPGTTIREWQIAEPTSHIHDIIVAKDQKIYGVDMSWDRVYSLDPRTGKITHWDFPESDLPLGGDFSGAYHPLGSFFGRFGPHSLQEGPNGKLWITASLSGSILSFDLITNAFENYKVPTGVYPHTLRFDPAGNLWFTIAVSNQIARLDLKTKKFKITSLPYGGIWQWLTAHLSKPILKIAGLFPQKNLQLKLSAHKISNLGQKILPLPYGLDINPKDGSAWYSKLNGGKIGRVDPQTFNIQEFEVPHQGPRRLRFSKDGILWIPSFIEGYLMRFDPNTSEFRSFKIPVSSQGEQETPYALAVHPKTQEIWITGGATDRLLRFNPNTESFKSYPLPTHVTFMRDLDFREDGSICTSYANLPGYAIEGGLPKIMCLTPGE